ncbi:mRNA capping enzyme-domain-containing protein [Aspergillus pseudodeflectus]|uniref:mRNA cap guanine-N(7) methyltransferase n=1 Tax=Aspergillus pseudodeflectus TaxID=176178 RepID=A0ABR4LAC3_9EURO
MADEQQPQRRVSGGAMYDAARDTWEDHHLQQQRADEPGPPPVSHPNELLASAQRQKLPPPLPNDPHLTANPELQNRDPASLSEPPQPSTLPGEPPRTQTTEQEVDQLPPRLEEKIKAYPVSATMGSPPTSGRSRPVDTSPEKNRSRDSPAAAANDRSGSPIDKKRKLPEEEDRSTAPADRSSSKRKRLQERHQKLRRAGPAPPSVYSRRDADNHASSRSRNESSNRSPSSPPRRSPSPEVRQRKRPGGGARMGLVDPETIRRRQEERARAEEENAMRYSQSRGVTDIVRQHYNAVPQRGREWRKTESKIKGLRTFNNWVKSTLIQKFSPDEEFVARNVDSKDWANGAPPPSEEKRLLVIDLGCGKGGDLGKWQLAPQPIDLYVGLDPADISIEQARDRYNQMRSGRGPRQRRGPLFHAEFAAKDCFGEWLGDVPIVQQVGIEANVGPGGSVMASRWGGGGFDVVASMFTIHYAFESEEKARQMLRNVAGCLKKGGRFLGVCPNSDIISAQVAAYHKKRKERAAITKPDDAEPEDGEVEDDDKKLEWGNSIYRVRFPASTPEDGVFRPPFGWKYSYFMQEAVEEIPEYVVPWEAFRALTEDYNLELQYRKPFLEVWRDEKDDSELGPLSERMGVRDRATGELLMTDEEKEAASFYHAFCFYKV